METEYVLNPDAVASHVPFAVLGSKADDNNNNQSLWAVNSIVHS